MLSNKSLKILSGLFSLIVLTVVMCMFMHEPASSSLTLASTVFTPLLWGCGEENMPGFKNRILFIPECIVSNVPKLAKKSEITSDDDLIMAKGAFAFIETDMKPTVIYCTPRTTNYNAEGQGEIDGKSYHQAAEYFFPGSLKEVHIHNRKIANTPGYYVFEDFDDQQYLIGQPGMPAITTPSFASGQAMTDRRGTTFAVECDAKSTGIFLATPIDIDELLAEAKAEIANPSQAETGQG